MTRINKLVLNGFKSFAKFTELQFGEKYNCVLGPNGSGKCLVSDSKVYLADGSLVNIGDLVNKKIKENKVRELDDGFVADGDATEILCLDTKKLKVKKRKIQAYIKRTSPKELVRIRTRSGRMITSTTYHPLFTLDGTAIKSVNAEKLKEGARIAVPRILPNQNSNYFFELMDDIKPKDNLYVPQKKELKNILLSIKESTWDNVSKKIKIPKMAIDGYLNGQSINFSYLIRILRAAKLSNEEIISKITHVKSKTSSKLCKIPWKNSKIFSRMLGYLLAEGRLSNSNQVWFTNGCEKIVEDYSKILEEVFGLRPEIKEYKPNCYDVLLYSRPAQIILSKFGMSFGTTEHKDLTNLYLKNADESELAQFINGIYCGDGYISKSSIEIVTKSKKLARAIELVLTRLGIIFNSKMIIKTATNTGFSGIYKQITIYGVQNFQKFTGKISMVHPQKEARIKNLLDKKANPNQDLIQCNSLIKEVAGNLGINIKKQKKQFPKLDAYVYNTCLPSRYGSNELLENLFLPLASSRSLLHLISLQKLIAISSSDILWDEIIDITTIQSNEQWVYDLCVEEDHNFIAENIFVHNSNILDALCFVLGKAGSKSLRAEKTANLIYNGGKSKKPAKKGEVSIYFDNKDKTFPTEESEVKVTRIIKDNGQSVYKINDQTRTRQQIIDLLNIARIDPDGYNIILQGDIVRFCEMSTVERRLLIEEISGISMYEEKKNKALNQLNKVDEKLKEAEIILSERSTYLKELKKDRDQALKFKEMNDNVRKYKASLLKLQIDAKTKEQTDLKSKIEENATALKASEEKTAKLKADINKKKEDIESITKEIEQKGETDQVNLNREIEDLKIDMTKKNTRVETLGAELEKLNTRKQELNKSLEDINEKIKGLNNSIDKFGDEKQQKTKEKDTLASKIKAFKEKNNIDTASDIEKRIDEIDKSSEELAKVINHMREKQHNLLRDKDKIEHELNTLKASIEKVKEIEKEHKNQLEDLKKKRQTFKETTLNLNKLLDEDSNLAAKVADKRELLHKSSEELAKLNARNASIKEFSSADKAIAAILEKKSPGIYGTVSELGSVDPKYSLALEMAAGLRIKSIVVENDKIASDQIKYLRQNRLGTATFLPLNKIKPKTLNEQAAKLTEAKGCLGKATDLVKYDSKFKKIFSYVFGDTLVVENIDVARRLGIGEAKMVTLDGDLTDISGSMRGGFIDKRRKGLGFKEDKLDKEIEKLSSSVTELEGEISAFQNRRKEVEEKIQNARTKKAELEGEIIKEERSLHLDSGDMALSKKKFEDLEASSKATEKEINNLQDEIRDKNIELAKIKSEKQTLRSKINQLRSPTLVAELGAYEEKNRQLTQDILNIDSEIKNANIQINDIFSPEINKSNSILKQIEKEVVEFKSESEQLNKKLAEQKTILEKKEKEAKDFYSKFKELFNNRTTISNEINKVELDIARLADKAREIEIRTNTLSIKNAEVSANLSGLAEEFKDYEGVPLDTEKTEEQLKYQLSRFEKMKEEIGSVNMRALEIYEEIEKEYNKLLEKKDILFKEKEDVEKLMAEIEGRKKDLFMKTYDSVDKEFQKIFLSLSKKGEASLDLENKEDPFTEGISIKVRITGQKFLDIRSLSGGEKTMTALAFIFAIQEHEPASFYILDEVDAALDKHNSEKLSKLVATYSDKAQYIIISHNDAMISEANNLYGISMDEHGVSKVVSLKV